MKKKIIFIIGPTASGKSEAAIRLAEKINGEIISCDSMQIYKGLDILSAKPSKQERKRIKHHLVDIVNPAQSFDVKKFVYLAMKAIDEIHKKDKIPIIAGGTGLYSDALLNGIFQGPAKNTLLRAKLTAQAQRYGNKYLHNKLKRIDPESAARIHFHDLRRVIRALEVYAISRKPISQLQKERRGLMQDARYSISIVGILFSRGKLYENINKRVDVMFERGVVKEIKKLTKKRVSRTFRQALGIKEVIGYLKGDMPLKEAKELIKRNTRHYAKRQLTWFRRNRKIKWVTAANICYHYNRGK